jgi:phosphatidylserine decarboxylase
MSKRAEMERRVWPVQIARGAWREIAWASAVLGVTLAAGIVWPGAFTILLAVLAAFAWLLVLRFFRDPERVPDSSEPEVVLSAADGRVVEIERVHEPRFLGGEALKIGVFMSILDVHVNRAPVAGVIALVEHVPGRFLQAHRREAALVNEHNWLGLQAPWGRVLVNQIAGIMARRIVCWVAPGQALGRGERLGMIKLGSRVEVYLPVTAVAAITEGEQVYAGKTVIARLEPGYPDTPLAAPGDS